jgi:predicted ATPase/DNA-binding CsgD family transcriptional regulator
MSNLPIPPTTFVGRATELTELAGLLADPGCRLLTLVGVGGVGKTRLAMEAATGQGPGTACRDGIYFVPLLSAGTAEFLISVMANAVGLTFHSAANPKDQFLSHLRDKALLLVVDNGEYLRDAVSVLVEILAAAPAVKLLIASREPLKVRGEWLFEVEGLPFPPGNSIEGFESGSSVQLFVQCARRADPHFALTAASSIGVARVCRAVAGLPLALELAAAWVRTLSCDEIAAEIEHNLGFLATSLSDIPERQRSLRAVFDSSWSLLSEAERDALRHLSVFRGGFERQAAEQVASASIQVLASLADKSLLRRTDAGRYDLHELFRQYAFERLSLTEDIEAAGRQHRDWCLALVEPGRKSTWGTLDTAFVARVTAEHDNLRAALQWSLDHDDANERLQFVCASVWLWYIRSHFEEGRQWLERALAVGQGASDMVRAEAIKSAGILAEQQSNYQRAESLLQEALPILRDFDPLEYSWTLLHLGNIAFLQANNERAEALETESLARFRAAAYKPGMASALTILGVTACYQQDFERAGSLLEESLSLLREVGDNWAMARAWHGLGMVARHRHDFKQAAQYFSAGLTLAFERGDRTALAECLEDMAGLASDLGNGERAVRIFSAAEALRQAIAAPVPPYARANHMRDVAATHVQVDQASFDAVWAEGRALALDQAAAYALSANSDSSARDQVIATAAGESLTQRELQILGLIADGLSNQDIAGRLVMSVGTIKWYSGQIYKKLAVRSRTQAVARARWLGFLPSTSDASS